MKSKRLLAFLLMLVMVLSCVTGIATMVPMDEPFYEAIQDMITHEDMPESALATSALAEHYNNSDPKNYFNEGDNIMYQLFSVNGTAGNRRDWYCGPNSEAAGKVLTNDMTGEYVVEHKLKFSNNASDVRYVGDNELRTQLKYSNNSKYDVLGFVIRDDNGDKTANIKFGYSADGAAASTVDLGETWTFDLAVWYTIRQIYNFDTMKADMYIYNAAGNEVGHYSHNIASGDYDFISFENIAIQAGTKSRIGLDDLGIYKTIAEPVTATFDEEMVTVTYDGDEVTSGVAEAVTYGGDATFKVSAKEGYVIKAIMVDGEAIDSTSEVSFTDVKAPHEIEVITKTPSRFTSVYKTLYETDFSEYEGEIVGTDKTHAELTQLASGYVKSGDDIYYYQCSNAALLSKWISPVGNNKVSADKSGEYVVTYKAQYTNYPYYQSSGSLSSHITYDSSDLNKSFLGYKIAWDVSGTATVSFKYRYKDTLDTALEVGTWEFTSGEWYTYRQVYNFDKMTAELYITDSKDKQVAYFKHDLQSEVNGTAIPYKDVVTSSMYSESANRGLVQISDYTFEKRQAVPVTVSFNEAKIDVTFDDEAVKSGEEVLIAYKGEEPAVFEVTPKTGYEIDKILVNGEAIDSTSAVELDSVTEAQVIEIIAAEPPVVTSLVIDGAAQVGNTISANAVVEDANGDNVTVNYQWQFLDGAQWKDITDAVSKDFFVDGDYVGKQLRVVVTPVSDVGPNPDEGTPSDPTLAVTEATVPPSADTLTITGEYDVGYTLNVTWKYIASESGVGQGDSVVVFEVADEKEGAYTPVQESTEKSYFIKNADSGKWLRIRVIPKDLYGVPGAELVSEPKLIATKMALFVATNGNDNNDGSINAPFATIEKARDTIRAMETLPAGGVVVNFRGGTYPVEKTIEFKAQDSGTEDCPIIYQAYNGEEVTFSGGKNIDATKIKKVTDEKILDGLIDEDAKDHLYSVNLKEQGITMHDIEPFGRGYSSFSPKQILMNGALLTEARWPNDDQSQMLVKCRPLTAKDGIDENKINANNTPIMFEYPDAENRSAKWNIKSGDAYIGGAIVYFWAQVALRIDNIDVEKKVVTSIDASTYGSVKGVGWGPQHKVYFSNIFAEIDQPGEYYVDRENGIMYFYPVGNVENAEMSVSEFSSSMVLADDLSYVTFKGLKLKDGRGTMLYFRRGDHLTVEDCEITVAQGGVSLSDGTKNSIVRGNHIYNMTGSAISIGGGDLVGLTPQNNLIENNLIHNFGYLRVTPYGIFMSSAVGNTIRNNEFNDFGQGAMLLESTVDTIIEYNKIMNGVQSATDMGAIYWGRNAISLGNVVRYNYFENLGSQQACQVLEGGSAKAIFVDDGSTNGFIYGNVFLDAGANSASVSSNGGEFGTFENNIFLTTDKSVNTDGIKLNNWGSRPERYDYVNSEGKTVKMKDKIPARVWLYLMDLRTPLVETNGNTGLWEGRKDLAWSQTWIDHYAGTQWERPLTYYGKKNYEAVKALADAGDRDGMIEYLDNNIPAEYTNIANNNLALNGLGISADLGMDTYDNYISTTEELTAEEKAMFVDYDNKNFALTDAGLAKVRTKAPKFQNIPFEDIGLLTDVGGSKPVVKISDSVYQGVATAGNKISADYDFSDADGDAEGVTKIYWYLANSANGKYTKIQAAQGKTFKLTNEYEGKYIKYEVVPYDSYGLRGEAVWSTPIAVAKAGSVNLSALNESIMEADKLLKAAVVGTGVGEYPQSAVDALEAAVLAAKEVIGDSTINQYQANQATESLEAAILSFKSKQNTATDGFNADIERISLNEILKDTDNWVNVVKPEYNVNGSVEFVNGSLVITGTDALSAWATYKGKLYKNTEFSFKYKAEMTAEDSSAWGGIYLRQSSDNNILWKDGNTGSMIDMKQDKLVLQEYPGTGTYKTLDNFKLEMGKEYEMTVGIYDLNNEDKVALVFTANGETIFAEILESAKLFGKEGFLGFNAGKNTKVTISPIVADTTGLDSKIAEAEALLDSVTEGDGYNQLSKEAIDALQEVLAEAKKVAANSGAVQYDINRLLADLNEMLVSTKKEISDNGVVSDNGTVEINYDLGEADISVEDGVKDVTIKVDSAKETPAINVTSKDAALNVEQGTVISGDFKAPLLSGLSPSGSFTLGEAVNTYAQGGSKAEANKPVRIVLKGQKGKQVAYKDGAKYVNVAKTVREDSFDAAADALTGNTKVVKMNSGDDIVIYTYLLSEFVTYERTVASDDDDDDYVSNNNGNNNNYYGGGAGGGGGFFSTTTTTPSANAVNTFVFSDMTNHWAKADVMSMYNAGIVSGVTATTFEPDRSITRAEFATLIAKGLKLKLETTNDFTDVKADDWFAPYVGAAAKAGIIVGADGKFRPNDTITREEMAVIIVKAYTYLGGKGANGAIDNFSDKAQISDWAKAYVDSAASAGLISGMGDGTFGPKANATRAQSASLVYRVLNR